MERWNNANELLGVRRRDPKALERFFDAFFPYVYSIAKRFTGHHEEAEDVTQDVFLKIYRAVDRLDVNRDPRPWVATITYNACRDAIRRRTARPEVAADAAIDQQAAPGTPEDVLLQEERKRWIEKALSALDEPSRSIVILHDYCGLSHDEIATTLKSSHDGVRKRYSRALKRMADIIRGFES